MNRVVPTPIRKLLNQQTNRPGCPGILIDINFVCYRTVVDPLPYPEVGVVQDLQTLDVGN